MRLIRRALETLQADGMTGLSRRLWEFVLYHSYADGYKSRRKKFEREVLSKQSLSERFETIHALGAWNDPESVSGPGSTLAYTENLRKQLPGVFRRHGISSVLDLPCGDFNWMKHLLVLLDVEYTGADIVPALIDTNKRNYETSRRKFLVLDLTRDALPDADVIFCRDCLFHLSYLDILSALRNISSSSASFLMTTTHIVPTVHRNTDIQTGDFRLLDLYSPPFSFPRQPLEEVDDWVPLHHPRRMVLFSHAQVRSATANLERFLSLGV